MVQFNNWDKNSTFPRGYWQLKILDILMIRMLYKESLLSKYNLEVKTLKCNFKDICYNIKIFQI